MTFDDQDIHEEASKKPKMKRACDVCRRKKIGCDGPQLSGGRCSNCTASNCECSYSATTKRRVNSKEYVAALETRLENMERLLKKLCPGLDSQQLANLLLDTSDVDLMVPSRDATMSPSGSSSHGLESVPEDTTDNADDYNDEYVEISAAFDQIKLGTDQLRFFGQSSHVMMLKKAVDVKKEYTGEDHGDASTALIGYKRREFWTPPPWELAPPRPEGSEYEFPEPDLMNELVDIYFRHINWMVPILHRPSLERSIADGLHLRDNMFASTLLMVCAVSSRLSDDPRVLMEGTSAPQSAGWRWFNQVRIVRRSLLSAPTLCELHFYCLSTFFLYGSTTPQACYTMVGIGIRLAQEVGAHRRKPPGHKYTVEDELWKRAFWSLANIDRTVSAVVGRPCAVQEEDFDIEMMIECDDEYWEHPDPDQAFKQPPGKPSYVACCNAILRLSTIEGRALRELYSVNKPPHKRGKEQAIVAELDSALNEWMDSIPDHLRWDPNRERSLFYYQSAALYTAYYSLQILIHRPFISTPRRPSPLTFPSLAICTNAARSCARIIDRLMVVGATPLPQVQLAAFSAALILLFHIWGGKKAGLSVDGSKGMEDVHKCMRYFKQMETRWSTAGRYWDILYELSCVGDLPLPHPSPPGHKRERDESECSSDYRGSSLSSSSSPSLDEPRRIAGSRRVAYKYANLSTPSPPIPGGEIDPLIVTPMSGYQLDQYSIYPLPNERQVEKSWDSYPFALTTGEGVTTPINPGMGSDLSMSTGVVDVNIMDEAFYHQMSSIFSSMGGRPDQYVAANDEYRMFSGAQLPPQSIPSSTQMTGMWSGYAAG